MQFSHLSSKKSVAQDHGVADDTGPWSSFVVARGQSVSGEHRRFTSVYGIFVRAPSVSIECLSHTLRDNVAHGTCVRSLESGIAPSYHT